MNQERLKKVMQMISALHTEVGRLHSTDKHELRCLDGMYYGISALDRLSRALREGISPQGLLSAEKYASEFQRCLGDVRTELISRCGSTPASLLPAEGSTL